MFVFEKKYQFTKEGTIFLMWMAESSEKESASTVNAVKARIRVMGANQANKVKAFLKTVANSVSVTQDEHTQEEDGTLYVVYGAEFHLSHDVTLEEAAQIQGFLHKSGFSVEL